MSSLITEMMLSEYFDDVEVIGVKPMFFVDGKMAKGALIIKCFGFNGKMPKVTEKY